MKEKDIKLKNKELIFTNSKNFRVDHIVASDGIKSLIREKIFSQGSKPVYSGYSAWRGFIKSENPNVEISFSKKKHLVSYPIDNNSTRSFTGVTRSKNQLDESWKEKGIIEKFLYDFKEIDDDLLSKFRSGDILLIQNEVNCIKEIINNAHKKNMKIVFNPAPYHKEILSYDLNKISILILNQTEGKNLSGENNTKNR